MTDPVIALYYLINSQTYVWLFCLKKERREKRWQKEKDFWSWQES